jgi:hypothetical protein
MWLTDSVSSRRDQMRRLLKLPAFIAIEYKKHQDSIVDKSSFRLPLPPSSSSFSSPPHLCLSLTHSLCLFRNTVVWRSTAAAAAAAAEGNNGRSHHDDKTREKGDRAPYGSRSNNQNSNSSSSGGAWKTNRAGTSTGNDTRSPRDPSAKYNSTQSSSSSGGAWTKATSGSAAKSPWRKPDSAKEKDDTAREA